MAWRNPTRARSYRVLLLCVTLAWLPAAALFGQAQATTGIIEGTVQAEDGSLLPGATVTLLNTGTNFARTVITDDRGRFRSVLLPLGTYRVTAALDGFATQVQDGIELTVGSVVSLTFQLPLSAVEQEIVVTAEAPLIETSSTQNKVTVDRRTLDRLPNNNRNFLEFTKLTPGVSIVQGPDGDELTINGQKGIQNNISVDGADFNNPFFGEQRGGQRPAFTFNIDAVQEFVVIADGAPAEYGRSSGGFVNVITKSGTNELKGTVNAFFKNDSLSARAERADGSKEPEFDADQQQIGFTLGGPIKRDKVFFFTALDVQDGEATKQNDPNRIDPRVVAAFERLGSPGENLPITRTNDAVVFLGKVDWRAGDDNLVTFRYAFTDSTQENGTFDVDSWGRSANAIEDDRSHAVTGSVISNLSSNLLNEARFQWAREERPRPYDGPNIAGTDRPFPDTAFDFVGQFRFGMPFFIPVIYNDVRHQINESVTWLKNDHTLKAGIEWNLTSAFQTFIGFANGRFIFSSTDGFLNYIDNPDYVECSDGSSSPNGVCPEGTEITGPVLLYLQQAGVGGLTVEEAGTQDIRQKEPAVFIQDTWQPKSNLTFTYGLRWEAQVQPDPITPPDEVFYAPFIGQVRDGQKFPSNGKIPSDYDMWQPRLGIAWDPKGDGRTVVRANAGIYSARIPGLVLASTRSTNGSRGQTLFRNSALRDILGPPPPYTELIPPEAVGDPFLPDVFVFDEDFQNPRTTSFALSWESEVVPRLSVLLKGNYNKTDHLTRFINRNDPLLGAVWSSGLPPGGANGINTLTTVESTAKSRYWGGTVGLTYRGRKLDFQGYYTYSKDKSDDDNERDPFTFRYARVTDLDAEWGFSDRDQRHRLNAWLLYRAPYGINLNARFTYRTPQPVSITETGEIANTPQDRINADGTVTRRNLGRKDNDFKSLDVRVSKSFRLGGREIELLADVFNVFNARNLLRPQTTNLVFNFDGTVTSGTGEPRQIQLGVRYVF
ncbi:MAG: TonB-dependent receptor [Acidobacteria bacterium]|nr:MAG: TonB-dependent receptor [Acidobacteriota bacterium]